MNKLLLSLCWLFFTAHCFANQAYVSGAESYFYHSGPSTKYKIKGSVKKEEILEIIDNTSSSHFYKIKTLNNNTGWVNRKYVSLGSSTQEKVSMLREELSHSVSLIKKQADEIHRLNMLVSTQKINNYQYNNRQSELTTEIHQLNNKLTQLDDSNLIRWLTHISTIILLAFLFIYLVITIKKRKKVQINL